MAQTGIGVGIYAVADGFLGVMNNVVGKLKGVGKAMSTAGKLAGAFGTAIAIVGAIHVRNSIQEFVKFEQQLAGLAKVMNDFDAAQVVARNIGELSEQMPVASEQMFEVAETAARLGIRGVGNIREFTRVATMMGAATDLAANQAADAFARILKQTNTPIAQFETLGSVVNELSNNMATTTSEIVDSVRRSAPELARLGFTAPEIAAVAASLNEVSESATRAGTRLRRLAQDLSDPRKIGNFAKALGETPERLRELLKTDAVGTLQRLIAVFKEGGIEAQRLASTLDARVRLALAALAQNTEGTTRALEIMRQQIAGPDSLQKEFDIFADTTAGRMQQVQNSIDRLQRQTGRSVIFMKRGWEELKLSVVTALTGMRSELAQFIGDLDELENVEDLLRGLAVKVARDENLMGILPDNLAAVLQDPVKLFTSKVVGGSAEATLVFEQLKEDLSISARELSRFQGFAVRTITNVSQAVQDEMGGTARDGFETAKTAVIGFLREVDKIAQEGGPEAERQIANIASGMLTLSQEVANGNATWDDFRAGLEQVPEILRRGIDTRELEAQLALFSEDLEQKKIALQDQLTELRFGSAGQIKRMAREEFGDDFMDVQVVREILQLLRDIAAEEERLARLKAFEDRREQAESTSKSLVDQLQLLDATTDKEERQIEHRQDMRDLEMEIMQAIRDRASASVIAALQEERFLKEAVFRRQEFLKSVEVNQEELKKFKKQIDEVSRLKKKIADDSLLTEEARLDLLTRSLDRMGDAAIDAFQKMIDGSEGAGRAMIDMIRSITAEILRNQLTALLFRTFLSGSTQFARPDNIVQPGDVAAPRFMASGGRIDANQLAIVGEKGPEMFVPRVSGTIVPNDKLDSVSGDNYTVNANFTVNAMDGADAKRVLAQNREFITGMVTESVSRSRQLKKRGL